MARREGRRRRRKAGPGKGGEGKGTRRTCGNSRGGGAVLAAARVRQAPHSNRPLAMTQQHAVRPRDHWGTAGRRSGEAEPGGWRDQGGRWEGNQERRGRARRRPRRVGARPLRRYRRAPAHCTGPPRAHRPRGPGPSGPALGLRWGGNQVFPPSTFKKCV